MHGNKDEGAAEQLRLAAGMGGVAAVTIVLLLAQLQLDAGLLFGA